MELLVLFIKNEQTPPHTILLKIERALHEHNIIVCCKVCKNIMVLENNNIVFSLKFNSIVLQKQTTPKQQSNNTTTQQQL